MSNFIGSRVGKYRIERLLGSGGMGSVYLAEHVIIGKKVAIKFLHKKYAAKKEYRRLFLREARTAAAIGHRNIIDIVDVGVTLYDEQYIIMEYLEGESLREFLSRKVRLELAVACSILDPILCALSAAHEKGIVHRDLKPDNIFLVNGCVPPPEVKLIDFGISKVIGERRTNALHKNDLVGTLAYMSPEQLQGKESVDGRADIYAVGVIFYEMLTGKLPFETSSSSSLIAGVLSTPPVPPGLNCPDFPRQARPLLLKMLSKDPSDRPQSARILLDQIRSSPHLQLTP